ncbi:hypothetical protein ACLQ2R_29795 [Streptosporangium sp. DT93]|uniref:hypothetical protein n=1 Tax=Streptosporangium sp. DT93 TaxID=3393428 RepID=UPI003CEBBDFF
MRTAGPDLLAGDRGGAAGGDQALNGKDLARPVNDRSPDDCDVLVQRERGGSITSNFGEVFAA